MSEKESNQGDAETKEIAAVLRDILSELKELNTSLKSIARSQANQTSVQKAYSSKEPMGGERR
jgi:hypothetical protein